MQACNIVAIEKTKQIYISGAKVHPEMSTLTEGNPRFAGWRVGHNFNPPKRNLSYEFASHHRLSHDESVGDDSPIVDMDILSSHRVKLRTYMAVWTSQTLTMH